MLTDRFPFFLAILTGGKQSTLTQAQWATFRETLLQWSYRLKATSNFTIILIS